MPQTKPLFHRRRKWEQKRKEIDETEERMENKNGTCSGFLK
jgi:hypothetical protein